MESILLLASSGVSQGGRLCCFLFSLLVSSIGHNFLNCKLLIFTEYMKLFMWIDPISDCVELQNYLDRVLIWFKALRLMHNLDKCQNIIYTRSSSQFVHSYNVYF